MVEDMSLSELNNGCSYAADEDMSSYNEVGIILCHSVLEDKPIVTSANNRLQIGIWGGGGGVFKLTT